MSERGSKMLTVVSYDRPDYTNQPGAYFAMGGFEVKIWSTTRFLEIPLAIVNDVIWRWNGNYKSWEPTNVEANMSNFVVSTVRDDGVTLLNARASADTVTTKVGPHVYTQEWYSLGWKTHSYRSMSFTLFHWIRSEIQLRSQTSPQSRFSHKVGYQLRIWISIYIWHR